MQPQSRRLNPENRITPAIPARATGCMNIKYWHNGCICRNMNAKTNISMFIGIAVWGDRISPVFDASKSLLVIEMGIDNHELSRRQVSIETTIPVAKVNQLRTAHVQTLICGAISREMAGMVAASGINLVPFVTGNTENILQAFLRGELSLPAYALPGCKRGGRRCRRGQARGPGNGRKGFGKKMR